MGGTLSKRMALRLMRLVRRILPPESRDWATAMEGEVGEVERPAAALRWAAGCLCVACRERLTALVRGTATVASSAGLLALDMEAGMHRLSRGVIVAAVAAPLLFLLAPSFRQGLAVQARLWTGAFNEPMVSAAELRVMANEAQKRGDAEALAFAALLHRDANERAAWAEEAVRRQPELTWMYAVLLARADYPAEANRWLETLRGWAPQNGFVCALEGNRIAKTEEIPGHLDYRQRLAKNAEWHAAMQAAFAAPEFDPYGKQQFDLIRTMMRRRGYDDPLLLVSEAGSATYAWFGVKRNLDLQLEEALSSAATEKEQARPAEAARAYRLVVEFGQRFERDAWSRSERWYAIWMQLEAYKPLRTLGPAAGDLVGLDREIARLEKLQREMRGTPPLAAQDAALHSSGLAVQICFLAGVLAIMLGAISGMAWLPLRRHAQPGGPSLVAPAGAIAILLLGISSLVLYVSYKPFAEVVEYFLTAPEAPREMGPLSAFAGLWSLPLAAWQLWWRHTLQVFFWYALIAAGGMVLIWLVARNSGRLAARAG